MFSVLIAVFLAETPDGLAAWQKVYSVLTSPRCINCHTATNYPQQGDDQHRHFARMIPLERHGRPDLDLESRRLGAIVADRHRVP